MKIVCPECGFSREVDTRGFERDSVIANCPQCSCRFRVSLKDGAETILPPRDSRGQQENPEEDIRQIAKRAYEAEAERFSHEEGRAEPKDDRSGGRQTNPWEKAPGESGWLAAFYQTVVRVMFSAQNFFSSLPNDAPQARPFLFYLIICLFQTLLERFWGNIFHALLSPAAMGDPQMEAVLEMLAPDNNLALGVLIRCSLLALQLYLFSFLMFLCYRFIAPQKATFALIFQIMCYSAAPSLLCVVPILGSIVGLFWGIGCLAVGCKAALKLNWPQTLAGFVPLLLVFAPLLPELMNIAQK